MLGATGIDAQGDQDRVVVVVDPIDHHDLQVQVTEWARQAGGQLPLAQGHEAARDRTARGRPLLELVGHGGQRRAVRPRRHARDDRSPRVLVERIAIGGPTETRQGQLGPVDLRGAPPANANPTTAQRDLACRRSAPHGAPRGIT